MGMFSEIDICLQELKIVDRSLAIRYLSGDSSAEADMCEYAAEYALDQMQDFEDDLELLDYITNTYYRS